jgi:hypothetical protein
MQQAQPFVQKKKYQQPKVEVIHLDCDIALVMMSSIEPPLEPSAIPGMNEYLQKIFKFGW